MVKREKTREEYKAMGKAMLAAIDTVRKQKGMRQADVSCPRCDFNPATYCLAVRRGSVYLSTFLAFCESLGVQIALYDEDGTELVWQDLIEYGPDRIGEA